tara:strand:+ start:194 stop:496 length:303 start_codon:yes stop_codon:yes gene_type:complete
LGRARATGGHGVYIHVQIHRSGFEQGVLKAILIQAFFFRGLKKFSEQSFYFMEWGTDMIEKLCRTQTFSDVTTKTTKAGMRTHLRKKYALEMRTHFQVED